jgi:AAA15 family ATPase/GTPase
MLISFSIENWMSFRDKTIFNLVGSRERQHNDRVPKVEKYPVKILPFAAIYGGNASGKTNFFKAINFVKHFIVTGSNPDTNLAIEPFKLEDKKMSEPSEFSIEFLVDEKIYEFSFKADTQKVYEEKLVEINSSSEKVLFHRKKQKPNFDPFLKNNERLKYAFIGTRENQLFLTNSVFQKIEKFRHIYNWFKNSLVLIAPDSRFEPFEQFIDEQHKMYEPINKMLEALDTGICHLSGEEIDFELLQVPEPIKRKLNQEIGEGITVRIHSSPKNERIIVKKENGKLKARKLFTFHKNLSGKEIRFEMGNESDGTQRVIDLLPAFLDIAQQEKPKTYIIDELDRSLHSLLTRNLLKNFLDSCSKSSRNQLLITTHDLFLMDQNLLRRDEMWIAEKTENGASYLIPFSDYKEVRNDKDIRKSYLQGRLGGIPKILINF